MPSHRPPTRALVQLKVWDRRALDTSDTRATVRPAGLLPGHLGGLTSVSPRGDGVYLVSNAKDQTAKLWDLRRCAPGAGPAARDYEFPHPFDYRYQAYPGMAAPAAVHPHDASVMTFRGHSVLQTLIKAHFSPSSTGGRFIFSGSADGRVLIWDLLQAPGGGGGGVHAVLHGHRGPVRDVAWHPTLPLLLSASFDGSLGVWTYDGDEAATQQRVWRANRRTNAAVTLMSGETTTSVPSAPSNAAAAAPRAPPLPDGLTCVRRIAARDHSPEEAYVGREEVDDEEEEEEEVDDVEVDDDTEDIRNSLFSEDADDDDDGSVLRALLAAVLAQGGAARSGDGGTGSRAAGGGRGNGT